MPTWRLRPPSNTWKWPIRGSLCQETIVESHVAGDDEVLVTYADSAEIPQDLPHIWLGGHVNTTTDPAIKDLWEANGYTVEVL